VAVQHVHLERDATARCSQAYQGLPSFGGVSSLS
jgi:hypothetical protein